VLAVAFSLSAAQRHTLILNGQSTEVLVIHVNGHAYVDLEALANALNGSVSSSGAKVALILPTSSANRVPAPTMAAEAPGQAPTEPPTEPAPSNEGFSREFLNAGIEEMSTLREWHTVLQTAIQQSIPLSENLLHPYRAQATTNLRFAYVAATTPADKKAYQLVNTAYLNLGKLSAKYVNMRANLAYIAPDSLQSDELNQSIVTCGRFLSAMAASGQFTDDGSCH